MMCYIRKGLIRPYLSSSWHYRRLFEHVERVYLHPGGRVYLGRVTLFAIDASLKLQWRAMGCLANSCTVLSRCGRSCDGLYEYLYVHVVYLYSRY